jgi:hypothetical protein
MRLYLRIDAHTAEEDYSDAGQQHIGDLLRSAPGVGRVEEVTRHPKGGWAVTLYVSRESLDALGIHLREHGFMAVL